MKKKAIPKIIDVIIYELEGVLAPRDLSAARSLNEHDEWGEALDIICTQLFEYDLCISKSIFEKIERVGSAMDLAPEMWRDIELISAPSGNFSQDLPPLVELEKHLELEVGPEESLTKIKKLLEQGAGEISIIRELRRSLGISLAEAMEVLKGLR